MLFKKKKLSVLQLAALLIIVAFAIVVGACPGEDLLSETLGTPIAADFNISGHSAIHDGSPKAVSITPKAGKSTGAITVYYEGTDITPSDLGEYNVTFDVAAAAGFNAVSGLSAGTLVIEKQVANAVDPIEDDFIIGGLSATADGNPKSVSITAKTGKSEGAITIYYNESTTAPSTAGNYTVTFDVAAATGFNAVTGLSAGTLVIQGAAEVDKNYVSGSDALSWGIEFTPLTLGLTPGNDTTEIKLNWYSSGTTAGKVAQVRFIRGTATAGKELIPVTGAVSSAGSYAAHKATVTGLRPGASYQYAVSTDGTNWSPLYDFKVPAAGAFKFAVIADPQLTTGQQDSDSRNTRTTTAAGWVATMEKIVAAGVSFIASGGDQVDTSNNETQYTNLFAPEGLRNLPLSPVVGNHDTNALFTYHYNLPNQLSITGGSISNNGLGNYFYLYNNILFVVLNTAASPGTRSAAATYIGYYNQTLTAAKTAHEGKYDWLIVQHHKSTASVADHCADRDIQYYVEAGFERIMSEHNVDFVLAGHDHVYARSYPLKGMDAGKVSVPNTTFPAASGSVWNNPGEPVYLTFTTGSGLKYYAVSADKTYKYANSLYVRDNASYPYLGTDENGNSTVFGSVTYMTGSLPVSNAAYVQPYIPSYCIVEVNGRSITFKTYAIVTASGTSSGASQPYSFDANVPYDVITVTK